MNQFNKSLKKIFPLYRDLRYFERKEWTTSRYKFQYPEYYSQKLQQEIKKRFEIAVSFLAGKPIDKACKRSNVPKPMIRRFANDLLRLYNIEMITKQQFGFKGEFGLLFAQGILLELENKLNRLPKTDDKEVGGVIGGIARREWKEFGILTWNDLLMRTFGRINLKMNVYREEKGLKLAQSEMKAYKNKYGRLPRSSDKEMGTIQTAAERGKWTSHDIFSWNDLLEQTFGEVNLRMGIYSGKSGLDRAQTELLEFKEKSGRLPRAYDEKMDTIVGVIVRGEWKDQKITSWNDLLRYTFGKINQGRDLYAGLKGLQRVQAELRAFKERTGRIPITRDRGMAAIKRAIHRGLWTDQGITCWNDLIARTFGTVKHRMNVYTGENGLLQAQAELHAFKERTGCLPRSTDQGMRKITGAIDRKTWHDKGIMKWNDLLEYTFGKVNLRQKMYKGKNGLQLAQTKLRKYKFKNVRLPKMKDKGMGGIESAIRRGEWEDYNVFSWDDLIRSTFRESDRSV